MTEQKLAAMLGLEQALAAPAQPEQDRNQWLISNSANWSWNPARYNAEIISGFAYKGTGYLGYTFEDAVDLAMRESTTRTPTTRRTSMTEQQQAAMRQALEALKRTGNLAGVAHEREKEAIAALCNALGGQA